MKTTALLVAALAVPMLYIAPALAQKKTTSPSWVKLKAATDKARYAPGQPIEVRLSATNTHRSGAYLRFTSGQRFDFSVFKAGQSETVYTWSAVRMFTQNTGSLWLAPKQTQQYSATIGSEMGELKAGKYRLVARLSNSPRPIVAPPVNLEVSEAVAATDSGLNITTRTDKNQYKIGEEVKIAVDVANRAGKKQNVDITWGMACDMFIRDEAGRTIWNYGANLRFIRALGPTTWKIDETKSYNFTWNGTPFPLEDAPAGLRVGRYQVQAALQTTPQVLAPPVFIEIVA